MTGLRMDKTEGTNLVVYLPVAKLLTSLDFHGFALLPRITTSFSSNLLNLV